MFVYLSIFASLSFLALGKSERSSVQYLLPVSVFLIWFMGFRYATGCDYYGYLHRWDHFTAPNVGDMLQGEEMGFALLTAFVKSLGLDYTWLNVAASIILVACYITFARAHRYAMLILVLLFPVVIIQLGMSGIRQAMAGGFLMLAFNAFVFQQKWRTAAWILLGMQFHVSVVIFLPLALMVGRKVSTARLALALAILGPVAALLLADRADTYSDRYLDGAVVAGGAVIRYALIALPVPFFFLHREELEAKFPDDFQFLKLSALLILSLAPLVVLSSIALHRLNYYVMPASILLFVYVGTVAFAKQSTGQLVAVLAYGGYSFFWFLSSRHAQYCYVPYENTFF